MIRPDDEEKPFVGRWNSLIRILLVESSVKLVARAAMDYADLYDGTSCHPSNERLARETGYSERTVRTAWAVLRGMGLAVRVSNAVAHQRTADEYELVIPDNWKSLPILGPRGRKFTCLFCERLINPEGHNVLRTNGTVGFHVQSFVFCSPPRKTKGRLDAACFEAWNARRERAGEPLWDELGGDVWKMFRLSRGDDW
ncbi:helix-turn-helix domain-containing protein [Streptosporangium sandarakinum]|uniref:helix-turn-helix domain-containing protein n=1 Tax=Streptosporangium sandarakinum TaxID=1260955 RepID=UPI003710316D